MLSRVTIHRSALSNPWEKLLEQRARAPGQPSAQEPSLLYTETEIDDTIEAWEGIMITKDMKIEEIIRKYPQTLKIFDRYGIDCASCHLKEFENLEAGVKVHKIDLTTIIKDLNDEIPRGKEDKN
jgi:hybrid cluster-associated redox disulfide protein